MSMRLITLRIGLMLTGLLLVTIPAEADVGVPMIFVTFPQMAVALIPIILIEALILKRNMPLSLQESLKVSAISNIISTLIGIPLTWIILTVLEMAAIFTLNFINPSEKIISILFDNVFGGMFGIILQSPWLMPMGDELNWVIPWAFSILLIPFFYASWYVEFMIAKRILKEKSPGEIKTAVYRANFYSYILLEIYLLFWMLTGINPFFPIN